MLNRLKDKRFRLEFIISLIVLIAVLISLASFLVFIEQREGTVLNDPLLALFPPINLTWLIFGLIYLGILTAVFYLFKNPDRLLFAIQLYALMVFTRIIAMYIVPLNPPANMIPLIDPLVEFFGTGKTLSKDLFFSGHTATLFILFLTAENKIVKTIFFTCTIIVGISVILQHVHYSIDVMAALFFTYSLYYFLKYLKSA